MAAQASNKSRRRGLLSASDAGDIDGTLGFDAPDYVDRDATEAREGAGGSSLEGLRAFGPDSAQRLHHHLSLRGWNDSRALVPRAAHAADVERFYMALDKGNASRAVTALEGMGAVSRVRDAKNHRVHWIEATARGRRLHARITEGLKRAYARRLRSHGGAFVRRVAGLLDELAILAHG